MKSKLLAATALGLAVALAAPAEAADQPSGKSAGNIMVRVRGIGVIPQNSSSSVSVIGGSVDATNTAVPEADFSYFFTDNIAAELIAATTQHDVSAINTALGKVPVGKVRLLPPTLTAQYHFMPKSTFSPYVGAGINYTWFFDEKAAGGAVTSLKMENGFGAVIQAGFDYAITDKIYANFDIKQVFLSTTAKLNGGTIVAKTDLNPTIIGAGIGYKF